LIEGALKDRHTPPRPPNQLWRLDNAAEYPKLSVGYGAHPPKKTI